MAGSRVREGVDGYQQQAPGGVIKRNLPRHFDDGDNRLLDRPGTSRSSFLRGGGGGKRAPAFLRSVLPYILFSFAVGGFILLAALLHRATEDGGVGNRGWSEGLAREGKGIRAGSVLRFLPSGMLRRFDGQRGLDRIRSEQRFGIRLPRLAVVLGTMEKDSSSLLLFTLIKNLQEIGYQTRVFAVKDGKARRRWELIGGQISMLSRADYVDWSIYEGVILSSVEARIAISRFSNTRVAPPAMLSLNFFRSA